MQSLVMNLRRNVNFDALMTTELKEKYEKNPTEVLLEIAEGLDLRPELQKNLEDAVSHYAGPALFRLDNGSWLCIVNLVQFLKQEQILIFDPQTEGAQKMGNVPAAQLKSRFGGELLIFRNLQAVDNRKQSGLFCLVSIGKHHQISMGYAAADARICRRGGGAVAVGAS
jgi:hypothetical protein